MYARRLGRPRRLAPASGARAAAWQAEVLAKTLADETTAPVLDPGRGETKTGQLWAYARDDRLWNGATRRASPISMRRTERPASNRPSRGLHRNPSGRRLRRLSRAG
ncbi:hypothetical protein MES5069_450023 [Mesorhizobium escarrei]|uniref:Transposase IS66 central domain-containing protein n=1 Tax=Mesorhizobium escarrei TaxID=666018 RepID=A0ABN8K434_9HYPH|nr:hypothetical protein MES5069_450023 [Mesorhizobium escarrei]